MNDQELIALLRRRVSTVERAVMDYTDAAEETGQQRQIAWVLMRRRLDADPAQEAALPESVRGFLAAYAGTLAPRRAALEKMLAALQTDFMTAVLTGDDWTNEQRAYWLERAAAHEAAAVPDA